VYIAKDRTGKPEKKKGPEPKFYGDLQKVIERAFRNVIFVCALVLFLILEICFTYAIGKMFYSLVGAFLLVIAIFLLVVNIDTWRKVKEE
jgi:uncharacterized membrane protein YoaK (UPF0700 family)